MKTLFRIFLFIVFSMMIQSVIVSIFSSMAGDTTPGCIEVSQELQQNGSMQVRHQRSWNDRRYHQDYCLAYEIESNHFRRVAEQKNDTEIYGHFEEYHEYWGEVYRKIVIQNQPLLIQLQDSLRDIQKSRILSNTEFANAIVKMVQDIPYAYVMSKACESEHEKIGCVPNQKFGLTAPIEFLYTLKGDCDSRTVLLYALLKYFGYDALIMISKEYLHSVLAIDIPVTGDHIMYDDRKFYFWETTATGWEAGILPPDMKNIKYWKIALNHEL